LTNNSVKTAMDSKEAAEILQKYDSLRKEVLDYIRLGVSKDAESVEMVEREGGDSVKIVYSGNHLAGFAKAKLSEIFGGSRIKEKAVENLFERGKRD
jgi:hypothetical protein